MMKMIPLTEKDTKFVAQYREHKPPPINSVPNERAYIGLIFFNTQVEIGACNKITIKLLMVQIKLTMLGLDKVMAAEGGPPRQIVYRLPNSAH